jgi:hypothetical protein
MSCPDTCLELWLLNRFGNASILLDESLLHLSATAYVVAVNTDNPELNGLFNNELFLQIQKDKWVSTYTKLTMAGTMQSFALSTQHTTHDGLDLCSFSRHPFYSLAIMLMLVVPILLRLTVLLTMQLNKKA